MVQNTHCDIAGAPVQALDRSSMDRGPHWSLVWLCNVVLGVFIVWVTNHFLLDEVVERFYARLSSPVIGLHLYENGRSDAVRERISVFLLDDDDLAAYGVTYPVPYSFHARRLRAIAAREPTAIFVDLWFHDQRSNDDISVLVDALCEIAQDGVRVYLASISHLGEHRSLHPALLAVAKPDSKRLDEARPGQTCFTEVAPLKQTDGLDGTDWEYPLQATGPGGTLPSAALAIYNELAGHGPYLDPQDDLALVWGVTPHPFNAQLMREPDTGAPHCRNDNLMRGLLPFSHEALTLLLPEHWLSADVPVCPYHLSLPVRVLRDWSDVGNPFHVSLAPAIANRVVIYGVNLQSVSDSVRSPVHDTLPGAHLHAMALDNLLRYGEDYPVAQGFDLSLNRGTLVPMSIIAALSLFLVGWGRLKHRLVRTNPAGRSLLAGFAGMLSSPERSFLDSPLERLRAVELIGEQFSGWFASRYRQPPSSAVGAIAWRSCLFVAALVVLNTRGLVSLGLRIALALAFLVMLALVSLSIFSLGPLTWIEFAIAPLVLELLGTGEKVAAGLVRAREAVTGDDWIHQGE
jgi:hypothetical protein